MDEVPNAGQDSALKDRCGPEAEPDVGSSALASPVPVDVPTPGVASDPATQERYDKFWARYKVSDPWQHLNPPDAEKQRMLESLGLWTAGGQPPEKASEDVSRESQRGLKRQKKAKEGENDVEKEDEDEAKDSGKPKGKAKAKAKAKGKAKAQGKAQAKAKAKGKAKSSPKAKAKAGAKAKAVPQKRDEDNESQEEDEGDEELAPTSAPTCVAIPNPDAALDQGPSASHAKGCEQHQDKDSGKKRRRRPGEEGHVPSFARRVCPKSDRASCQWHAIKDAFNQIVRPRVQAPSLHEDLLKFEVLHIHKKRWSRDIDIRPRSVVSCRTSTRYMKS